MDRVRRSADQLQGLTPYDPKYLPASSYLSANENPHNIDSELKGQIEKELKSIQFNRYPDPLANRLRDLIAEANGLARDWVLIGNGGDELLFDTALAWGGPGRKFLNLPPTFSVYNANAVLTNTEIVEIPRLADDQFAIDEEAVLKLASDPSDGFDFTIIASPNNPTGKRARTEFIVELLDATDALVLVDEAYFEFSRHTIRPYLEANKNLVILRTFSKAFSLAGVRIGYILAHPDVIEEYLKVRQPYSVDALSQAVGSVIFENRAKFEPHIEEIIAERERLMSELNCIPGVKTFESDSNWILFKLDDSDKAWEWLYSNGILVRDFSDSGMIKSMLRVSVGTKEQNSQFIKCLRDFVMRKE